MNEVFAGTVTQTWSSRKRTQRRWRPRDGRTARVRGPRARLVTHVRRGARGIRWCVPVFWLFAVFALYDYRRCMPSTHKRRTLFKVQTCITRTYGDDLMPAPFYAIHPAALVQFVTSPFSSKKNKRANLAPRLLGKATAGATYNKGYIKPNKQCVFGREGDLLTLRLREKSIFEMCGSSG